MLVFGWIIVSLGSIGLCCSMAFEIIINEPYLLLIAKGCIGIMGIGGIILGTERLKHRNK